MFGREMQMALEADGEKLRQLTGEDHGPYFVEESEICIQTSDKSHEAMVVECVCPRCDERELYRDSVDVGVGIIHGPCGCPCCGWSEDSRYDLASGGGLQDDGSYLDPYGGLTPAANPIAKMLAAEANAA